MKPIKIFSVMFFMLSVCLSAQQKVDYSKEAGYFDFKEISHLKNSEPTTEVYLEEPMLKMIGNLAENKKEGIGNVLAGLKLIMVNEFDVEQQDINAIESSLGSIDKTLQAQLWDRIIRSKNKNSLNNVYVRRDQSGEFAGLIVTSMHSAAKEKTNKGAKLTLVNIVGKIDLSALGAFSKQFNIPWLEKSSEKEKEK